VENYVGIFLPGAWQLIASGTRLLIKYLRKNLMFLRRNFFTAIALGLVNSAFFLNSAPAQGSVVTDPVGFTTTTLLGGSDSLISIAFTRPPEFIGAIASGSGSTITLVGNPLIASQFLYGGTQHNHYYALIGPISGTGTKEGHTFQITDNTTSTLTVVTGSDNLTGIPANTQVEVIPYWTPATIFPATDANVSFTPTSSPPTYQTLLRVPNYSAAGINLPYSAEYYFNNNAWQRISGGDGSDDPLLPDGYFVVRNNNGAPTLPLTNIGSVLLKKLAVPLTATSQQQDNPVSMVRPVNVALDATGLGPGDNSFGAGDQLLVFNNAAAGIDKSPSSTYYYDTAAAIPGWRLTGDTTLSDRGADIIPAGNGFVIRKAAGGQSAFWTNAFPLAAVSAVSTKVHGGSGTLGIPLPLGGSPGIECRSGGITQIVFTFPTNVTVNNALGTQGGRVTSGTGSVASVSGAGTGTVTVNLSGVANAQWNTVTLYGVSDGINTNDVAVQAGVLLGDSTGDRSVNSADISQTKSRSGQAVGSGNFRSDVAVDGSLNSADISLVKSRSGTALP
jgi:uncharacterized protein (TIGR02597 family)